ncbi:trypsin-1-like protein, partial [Leptotrombidium deliense]
CGVENVQKRNLPNRSPIEFNKYPWIANIQLTVGTQYWNISGSVINQRYILTVSLGVVLPPENIKVFVGRHKHTELKHSFRVEKIISHENFGTTKRQHNNDIALLKLDTEIKFNDKMRPICLPTEDMKLFDNFVLVSKGNTISEKGEKVQGNSMQEIFMHSVDFNECKKMYPNYIFKYPYKLKDEMHMCASSNAKHICKGDYGAALMYKQKGKLFIAGMASFAKELCSEKPAVFTNIIHYLPWINENTKDIKYCAN